MIEAVIGLSAPSPKAGSPYCLEVEHPRTHASITETCSTMMTAIDRAERLIQAGYKVQIRCLVLPDAREDRGGRPTC